MKRTNYWAPIITLLMVLVVHIFTWFKPHTWVDDFALYIQQAEALESGSIGILKEKQSWMLDHSDRIFSPLLYPWVQPILLLGMHRLTGDWFVAGRLLNILFLLAGLWIFYRLAYRFMGRCIALLAVAISGFLPEVLLHKNTVGSDWLSFGWAMGIIYLLCRPFISGFASSRIWSWAIGLGLLLGIASLTRVQFLAWVPAVGIVQWMVFRRYGHSINAVSSVAWWLTPIALVGLLLTSFYLWLPWPSYRSHLVDTQWWLRGHFIRNLAPFFQEINSRLWPVRAYGWPAFFAIGLVAAGWWKWRLFLWPFLLLLLLNTTLIIALPYPPYFRYSYFITPFYWAGLLGGIAWVAGRLPVFKLAMPVAGFVLLLGFSFIAWRHVPDIYAKSLPNHPHHPAWEQTKDWLNQHIDKNQRIAFFKPRLMHWQTEFTSYCHRNPEYIEATGTVVLINQKHTGELRYNRLLAEALASRPHWKRYTINDHFECWIKELPPEMSSQGPTQKAIPVEPMKIGEIPLPKN